VGSSESVTDAAERCLSVTYDAHLRRRVERRASELPLEVFCASRSKIQSNFVGLRSVRAASSFRCVTRAVQNLVLANWTPSAFAEPVRAALQHVA